MITLGLGNFLGLTQYRYHAVNCQIIECRGWDYAAILFGGLALILAWRCARNAAMREAKWFAIGVAVAGLLTLTHGLGLGPGSICPDQLPDCRKKSLFNEPFRSSLPSYGINPMDPHSFGR